MLTKKEQAQEEWISIIATSDLMTSSIKLYCDAPYCDAEPTYSVCNGNFIYSVCAQHKDDILFHKKITKRMERDYNG